MKQLLTAFLCLLVVACGENYEETKRLSRAERLRLAREDSAALKVGVLPTLDCLPFYVAQHHGLYEALHADVRLKPFGSQIDCDAALVEGKIEGNVTDLVRAERMQQRGTPLRYVTSTNAYWQLVSNRRARITQLKQLDEKMVAMARFSATHLLSDVAVDSVRLKPERVFRVQINDPNVRLQMLLNNEMDAMLLTEPQATTARIYKNPVLMDSRDKDIRMGVVAFREKNLKSKERAAQLKALQTAYNMACDSIRKHGVQHYGDLLKQYAHADDRTLQALPKLAFGHLSPPRQKDIDRARKFLK